MELHPVGVPVAETVAVDALLSVIGCRHGVGIYDSFLEVGQVTLVYGEPAESLEGGRDESVCYIGVDLLAYIDVKGFHHHPAVILLFIYGYADISL